MTPTGVRSGHEQILRIVPAARRRYVLSPSMVVCLEE
jgi:hypothetical protein